MNKDKKVRNQFEEINSQFMTPIFRILKKSGRLFGAARFQES